MAGACPREPEGEGITGEAREGAAGARRTSRLVVYSLPFALRRGKGYR